MPTCLPAARACSAVKWALSPMPRSLRSARGRYWIAPFATVPLSFAPDDGRTSCKSIVRSSAHSCIRRNRMPGRDTRHVLQRPRVVYAPALGTAGRSTTRAVCHAMPRQRPGDARLCTPAHGHLRCTDLENAPGRGLQTLNDGVEAVVVRGKLWLAPAGHEPAVRGRGSQAAAPPLDEPPGHMAASAISGPKAATDGGRRCSGKAAAIGDGVRAAGCVPLGRLPTLNTASGRCSCRRDEQRFQAALEGLGLAWSRVTSLPKALAKRVERVAADGPAGRSEPRLVASFARGLSWIEWTTMRFALW